MATWEYRPRTRGHYVTRDQVSATTDPNGQARAQWKPAAPGYYQVEAEIRDEEGRRATHTCHVWVVGKGDYAYEYPALQLIPQRRSARPRDDPALHGDERSARAAAADRGGPAHLREARGADEAGYRDGGDPRAGPSTCPRSISRPRCPHKSEIATATVAIRVPDTEHRMDVSIEPDREDYRPGQSASILLRTSHHGRAVSASVAMGVVDEAIYALRPENAPPIHRFFYGYRHNQVQTVDMMPRPVVAGFQTVDKPKEVRQDFKDTAFWQANILTGEDGTARVTVPLPDNLTRWRATARGVALPAEVGEARAFLVTRKPLMVSTVAPRFPGPGGPGRPARGGAQPHREADAGEDLAGRLRRDAPGGGQWHAGPGVGCQWSSSHAIAGRRPGHVEHHDHGPGWPRERRRAHHPARALRSD